MDLFKNNNTSTETLLNVYEKYNDAIYRHCLYRVFNKELAEDLTQEVFLKFFQELKNKNKHITYPKSFLYTIANHLIIDYIRKKKEGHIEDMINNGYEPSVNLEFFLTNNIDANIAIEALKHVEEELRIPVIMRYIDELKPKEIADILGISQNIVSVRIYRGLKKLRQMLK